MPLLLLSALFASIAFAQDKNITGTITDDKLAPLVGATISVKGTQVVTSTGADGHFSISVPPRGKVLVVSYIGMEPQEITIANQSVVSVSLATASGTLSDVVVVGYGRSKRTNLTTAQTSLGTKEIEKTINTTVEQALQGRAPGVYITQNSGQPGGGISVNIRGINSINGNTEPLYVIDGVQLRGGGTANSTNPLAF
ncbi:MAG: carboxypeptidase-like regulatory domain-containing protein, partial [Bacteroidota bacterium]